MSREAMKQALEALNHMNVQDRVQIIAALRERLAQPEMELCAGRNCGSTNPNLHSAECFEDYEKSTGMNQWQQVDLTYHADGNVGIGTPPDAYAQPVIGEPVERIRFILSNQEPEEHVFAHPTTEWARVDKDLNVTHLDMELCAKGPKNVYTALAMAIWNKAIETEREKVAQWMMAQGYSTGHGDNIEDLLKELEWQIEDRIKNIIRTKTTYVMQNDLAESVEPDEESDK